MIKISIIVPIYNSENTLKKCLDSIIMQSYTNTEIILVNDGSDDQSLNIIKKYEKKDKRILVLNQENQGVSVARNRGIESATGDYITFIDSDDFIDLDLIKNTVDIIKRNNCDVVRNNYKLVYKDYNKKLTNNEIIKETIICKKEEKASLIKKLLLGKIQSYVWLLTINRKILMEKNIRFDENIFYMEDIVFFMKIIFSVKDIYFVKKENYYYFQDHKDSLTKNKNKYRNNIYNILKVSEKLENMFLEEMKDRNEYIGTMNAVYLNAIIGYLKTTVRQDENYSEILDVIKKIRENDIIKKMIKNKKTGDISVRYRIYILLFQYRMYDFLIMVFKIEGIIDKLYRKRSNII